MSPFIGYVAVVAGAIIIGILMGAIAGAVNGGLRGDLSVGALLAMGAYTLVVMLDSPPSGRTVVFGLLPLILSYLVASSTAHILQARLGQRPALSALAGHLSALLMGFLYLMLLRSGRWAWPDPGTAWIALAILTCLVVLSIQKRMRARR